MKKDIKDLIAYAEELGWVYVRRTGDDHHLMRHPVTRQQQTIPSTPNGGKRGLKNCKQDLKRKAENPR